MKTISITVNNRPHYLRHVLGSLKKNDLRGYELFCQLEPGSAECFEICHNIDFMPAWIAVNETRRGVRHNPYELLKHVFDCGSVYNIYLEDDVIVSPDAIHLANWYSDHKTADQHLCLCLFNYESDTSRPDVIIHGSFAPLGFCLLRDQWEQHFQPNWYQDERGWDFSMTALANDSGLSVAQPALSRTNHIGREGGTHCDAEFHDKAFSRLAISDYHQPLSFRFP